MGCERCCCMSKVLALYPVYIGNACVRDVRVGLFRSTQARPAFFSSCTLEAWQISDRPLGLAASSRPLLLRFSPSAEKRAGTALEGCANKSWPRRERVPGSSAGGRLSSENSGVSES